MKREIKRTAEKGITLVALVITIVILIILATITINVAFGEGGLIERAQQAKELTEQATKDEEEKLNAVMSEYGDLINGMNGGSGVTPEPEEPALTDEEINGILSQVYIPNSITTIGNSVFRDCTSLTTINIPNSVPNSITTIGNSVFRDCTSLTTINIPNSVTTIGKNAFEGCTNLKQINIDNTEGSITGENWAPEGVTINWKRK